MISLIIKITKKGKTDMKYCYEMGLLIDKWEDSGLGKLALSVAHGTK